MAARLPYVNREELPEADREIFDRVSWERGGAPVGNIFRTLATHRTCCAVSTHLAASCATAPNSIRSCANSR